MNENDTYRTPVGYDNNWYISEGWTGLYPPQFSVCKKEVTLYGRNSMTLMDAQTVHCSMPQFATYSPWNAERKHDDQLRFFTASSILKFIVNEPETIETESWFGEDPIILNLQQGEVLERLITRGSDLALYRYQGVNYLISEEAVASCAQVTDGTDRQDLWVNLPASNGQRAWILFDDAIAADGIEETYPESFGTAQDLESVVTPKAQPKVLRQHPLLTLVPTAMPTAA